MIPARITSYNVCYTKLLRSVAPVATVSAAEQDAYLAYLRARLQEALRYPRRAERLGLTGEARVRFAIGPDGELVAGSLELVLSSGHAS